MHLDDINRFFQSGVYNDLKNDVSTFNLTAYQLGEVQTLMKQAKVTNHPVVHLWLLDAKYAYLKATLGSEDGRKMSREAKQNLITDCILEVESTI